MLCSKFVRYLLKVYIDHTVHVQVDDLKELPLPVLEEDHWELLGLLASQIVSAQRRGAGRGTVLGLQDEVDRVVYEHYGLTSEDVIEVEAWYMRRYPTLAAAQAALLKEPK